MALFDCACEAQSGHARALSYETAHGTFRTPMFMPVGTSASVKGVTVGQLRDLDAQVVLANTYHLSLRPGADVVAEAGGVHAFMHYDGPMPVSYTHLRLRVHLPERWRRSLRPLL